MALTPTAQSFEMHSTITSCVAHRCTMHSSLLVTTRAKGAHHYHAHRSPFVQEGSHFHLPTFPLERDIFDVEAVSA